MNVYLLKARRDLDESDNPWNPWFDKTFGYVIRALSMEEAREIAQYNSSNEHHNHDDCWLNPFYSTCEILHPTGPLGVVLEDYHAA